MIEKGTWIEIRCEILKAEERAENLPWETKEKPLLLWAKGFAKAQCNIGEEVEIETIIGRTLKGIVTEKSPRYSHDFGEFVPELLYIGKEAKRILKEG